MSSSQELRSQTYPLMSSANCSPYSAFTQSTRQNYRTDGSLTSRNPARTTRSWTLLQPGQSRKTYKRCWKEVQVESRMAARTREGHTRHLEVRPRAMICLECTCEMAMQPSCANMGAGSRGWCQTRRCSTAGPADLESANPLLRHLQCPSLIRQTVRALLPTQDRMGMPMGCSEFKPSEFIVRQMLIEAGVRLSGSDKTQGKLSKHSTITRRPRSSGRARASLE